jgi:hypothetical protein
MNRIVEQIIQQCVAKSYVDNSKIKKLYIEIKNYIDNLKNNDYDNDEEEIKNQTLENIKLLSSNKNKQEMVNQIEPSLSLISFFIYQQEIMKNKNIYYLVIKEPITEKELSMELNRYSRKRIRIIEKLSKIKIKMIVDKPVDLLSKEFKIKKEKEKDLRNKFLTIVKKIEDSTDYNIEQDDKKLNDIKKLLRENLKNQDDEKS